MDLALPEDAMVAEIIPGLLAKAGESLADSGLRHGGWVLRRFDGTPLDHDRTLAANRLKDGELLRLAPRRLDWPELEYDDLVHAIAGGARSQRQRWTARHTRVAGLGLGAAAVLLGLLAMAHAGPDWTTAARWAFGQTALLLVAGVVLARVVGDSVSGAVAGLSALPYAFAAGATSQGGGLPLSAFGAPQLLVGCAALTAAALVGYVAVADGAWLFAAGVATGLFGLGGVWVSGQFELPAYQVAAVLVSVLLPLSPMLASLAIRLGKLPLPVLPRTTADLLRDDPQPPRTDVYHAVARADALLTGMLMGSSVAGAVSVAVLMAGDSTIARVLGAVGSVGFLLRARLYPVVRQRVPLLVAGLSGPTAALLGTDGVSVGGSGLVAFGAVLTAVGIVYSQRVTSPYLRRAAEYAEILLVLSVVPLGCWVLGLYGHLRGLAG
jgi:type VII secretion integral membrane protein EccD